MIPSVHIICWDDTKKIVQKFSLYVPVVEIPRILSFADAQENALFLQVKEPIKLRHCEDPAILDEIRRAIVPDKHEGYYSTPAANRSPLGKAITHEFDILLTEKLSCPEGS